MKEKSLQELEDDACCCFAAPKKVLDKILAVKVAKKIKGKIKASRQPHAN